jgi:hypothetical protein
VRRNKLQADEMEDDPFDKVQEILNCERYTAGEKECVKFHLGSAPRSYTGDEGGPLGAGLQEQASNHLKLHG